MRELRAGVESRSGATTQWKTIAPSTNATGPKGDQQCAAAPPYGGESTHRLQEARSPQGWQNACQLLPKRRSKARRKKKSKYQIRREFDARQNRSQASTVPATTSRIGPGRLSRRLQVDNGGIRATPTPRKGRVPWTISLAAGKMGAATYVRFDNDNGRSISRPSQKSLIRPTDPYASERKHSRGWRRCSHRVEKYGVAGRARGRCCSSRPARRDLSWSSMPRRDFDRTAWSPRVSG